MASPRTRGPAFRISCCLCRKPAPTGSDVHALDEEWQRRYPDMVGTLACDRCALNIAWTCHTADGRDYVPGHRRAVGRSEQQDFDAWSHLLECGTQKAMVQLYPWAGLQQGAEDYPRRLLQRPRPNQKTALQVQDALRRWDERNRTAVPTT